jgi:hypothetical protein
MNIAIKLYINKNIYEYKVCVLLQNETFYNYQCTMVLALSKKLYLFYIIMVQNETFTITNMCNGNTGRILKNHT